MNKKINFSIIMPTYNRGFCIDGAIDSVLNQSYQNFELIIVDDGSNDGTDELIQKNMQKKLDLKRLFIKDWKKILGFVLPEMKR